MQVQPYLFLDGRCEEALTFYHAALGAEITALVRYSESPEPCDPQRVPPGSEHKIMHACFKVGASTVLASDGGFAGRPNFQGISLTLTVADRATAETLFSTLLEGGSVQMPLTETFFSPCFGMLADRFGVSWMILAKH